MPDQKAMQDTPENLKNYLAHPEKIGHTEGYREDHRENCKTED